jgi:hypothetical protein
VDAAILIVTRRQPPLVAVASRRDYTDFVTAAFEGARPTVASALARAIPRARFAGLARELGFGAGALPSQLTVHQWAGLFRAAGPSAVRVAGASGRGPAAAARSRAGTARGPASRPGRGGYRAR